MSHHFDISTAKQDISDVMCFAGPQISGVWCALVVKRFGSR